MKFVNKIENIFFKKVLNNLFTISIFILIIFGRNFTGVYLFQYRIGEIIIGFFIILTHLATVKEKDKDFKSIFILLLIVFYLKLYSADFETNNFLLLRFSSIIWVISAFFAGLKVKLKIENFAKIFVSSLIILYLINYIYYPKFIKEFFILNSDKFDFTKPSDLFLVFCAASLYLYKISKFTNFVIYFLFGSIFYAPVFYYQSRGAFLAYLVLVLLLIFEIITKKLNINIYKILIYIVGVGTIFIYFFTTRLEQPKISDSLLNSELLSIELRIKLKPNSFIYLDENLLRSSDKNIDWRLTIWQTTISDMMNQKKIIFGNKLNNLIPIMNHPYYQTIKLQNYNLHNYLIQFFAYFGLVGIFILCYLFYKIIIKYYQENSSIDILIFIIPVIVVSSFDSSMESVRFPVLFYFILGNLYINEVNKHKNL